MRACCSEKYDDYEDYKKLSLYKTQVYIFLVVSAA